MKWILIVTFLESISASIDIEISTELDTINTKSNHKGELTNRTTNFELFGLSDDKLKSCLKTYMGRVPDKIFFNNSNPWYLYRKYGWKEIVKVVIPKYVDVTKIKKQRKSLKERFYYNTNVNKVNFSVSICEKVENSFRVSWNGPVGIEGIINYDIILATQNRASSFKFNASFGQDSQFTVPITLGHGFCANVTLVPGQLARAELTVDITTVGIQITYEAYLSGVVALAYDRPHNGHHFWAPNIDHVLYTCGTKNGITSEQYINISYYDNANLVFLDLNSGITVDAFRVPVSE
uniref:Uncharacterized protein n=1 Tax=Bombyx mori TaxID=7091 RepID=A0A8R2M6A7_BOMMO|nr:spherulin-2A [Bombyx mori]XP_037875677.1 spherulin-2A [Bombyx mori]